jgi:prepilin-type N-terminal cleavage/methylation domain-containing protein
MTNPSSTRRGFTLIELLVVITIIGMLVAVAAVSMNTARKRGRDATRKQELRQLQAALELYHSEHREYPRTPANTWYSSEPGDAAASDNSGNYIPGLAPTYIAALPRDPSGLTSALPICTTNGWKQAYLYRSDGRTYKLLSHCTLESLDSGSEGFFDIVRPGHAWMVCGEGATACTTW